MWVVQKLCAIINLKPTTDICIEASPLFRKFSYVSVADFHKLGVVYYYQIIRLAEEFSRVDIAFDRYFLNSLKTETRTGRESEGKRITSISDDTPFPKDYLNSFLCNAANKDDLGFIRSFQIG